MVGIIISIIATAIISIIIAKWQMKKNKIVHFTINSYDIGKGLSDEFPKFKLQYDSETLSKNVSVLKGGFMNTGKNDIEQPDFTLILPKDCVVKTIKITPSTNNLKVKATIDEEKTNAIQFTIDGIFISDEYFEYTAIVEVPERLGDLDDSLTFNHRIKNTEKINNIYVGYALSSIKRKKGKKRLLFVMAGCYILMVALSFCQELKFNIYEKTTNKEMTLMISPKLNLYVDENSTLALPVITGKRITTDEFNNDYTISPKVSYRWFYPIWTIVLYMAILFVFGYFYYDDYLGKKAHVVKVLIKNKNK